MRGKRFLSFVLSAVTGISAAAGMAVQTEKTAKAASSYSYTAEYDYIGSSTEAETFDGYSVSGGTWDKTIAALGNSSGFGIHSNITYVAPPEVGATVKPTYTPVESTAKPTPTPKLTYQYPTYVSQNALAVRARGKSTNTAKYTISDDNGGARSKGKVYLKTDIGRYTDYVQYTGSVYLFSSTGASVLEVKLHGRGSTQEYEISGSSTVKSTKKVDGDFTKTYGIRLEAEIDLDTNKAKLFLDYISTEDKKRYQDNLEVNIADTDVAGLGMTVTGEASSKNFDTMLDNTQFYATEVIEADGKPQNLKISYKTSSGTEIASTIKAITEITTPVPDLGKKLSYYVPAYIKGADGKLYSTTSNYSRTTQLTGITTTANETVSLACDGVYQYVDFDDTSPYARPGTVSNGMVSQVSSTVGAYKDLITVRESGYYNIIIAVSSVGQGIGDSGATGSLRVNNTDMETFSYNTNTAAMKKFTGVYLTKDEVIKINCSNSRGAVDYILIKKIADANGTNDKSRKMEKLDRGTVAVDKGSGKGVYLSWRLLGTENLSEQEFDIYRDGIKIETTDGAKGTNYTDKDGSKSNKYIVVKKGESIDNAKEAVWAGTYKAYTNGGTYLNNETGYFDIPITSPAPEAPAPAGSGTGEGSDGKDTTVTGEEEGSGSTSDEGEEAATATPVAANAATYTANDASVGDLDGDGEYEIVLKWYPSNSKDNSQSGLTSNVYIDAYEMGNTDGAYKWRINLGSNIRSGAHYTQFMVYDFDGDGKAEVVMKTAPGSKDGKGNYVTEVGDTETIRTANNNANYRNKGGYILDGPEYLTVFDGETGAALATTDFIERGYVSSWGDSYGNRVDRFNAAVAYLDGKNPSIIMARGYYAKSVMAAYNWDGRKITRVWQHEALGANSGTLTTYNSDIRSTEALPETIYGEGNHSIGVCDADNDGKDEIVFGSAVVDDDGRALHRTGRGHGDAHHISDFNNDGLQDIFNVHEASSISAKGYAAEYRLASSGDTLNNTTLQASAVDNGRGVMDNFIDDIENYGHSQFYSSGITGVFSSDSTKGTNRDGQIAATNPKWYNFSIYWDDDLAREQLDGNKLGKLVAADDSISLKRFLFANSGSGSSYFTGSSSNNSSKSNPCLSADILGDWREEVIFRASNNGSPVLRVFVSAIPTTYRLYTLMHDAQYREGVAIENVGYNQPPHTSYYIGSAALAKDETTGEVFNYLTPAVAYTNVEMVEPISTADPVTVSVGTPAKVTADGKATWDLAAENILTIPDGRTVSGDDITFTIGGYDIGKTSVFNAKTINGGTITFKTAITDIPSDVELSAFSDTKFTISAAYAIADGIYRTANGSNTVSVE